MYTATTGMLALGTGMQTISNNLANVNTVGFKSMRTNYQDLISECYYSGNNHNQVGKGARVESIQTIFKQGAFVSDQQDTDLAIAGEGFFNVRHHYTGEIMYTRAGAFNWDEEGYLVDQSGNILQGWEMAIPEPGTPAARIGEPVDIQLTSPTAPPEATTSLYVASNLDADEVSKYYYPENALADAGAHEAAESAALASSIAAADEVWSSADTEITAVLDSSASASTSALSLIPSSKEAFNINFISDYNEEFKTNYSFDPTDPDYFFTNVTVVDEADRDPANGKITEDEFDDLVAEIEELMENLALEEKERTYYNTYNSVYDSTYEELEEAGGGEGFGFAGAWDANKEPPIDPEDYSFAEPMTVYDETGTAHDLMIYYQKNPHMENVWDYIVTIDPNEDARAVGGGDPLFTEDSSFAGLIQKGKITFTGDDDELRHGGLIKTIEAENFDIDGSMVSSVAPPSVTGVSTGSALTGATIGGTYQGSGAIDPATGQSVASARTYTISWGYYDEDSETWEPNGKTDPPTSGLTWTDSDGNSGFISVSDKSYPGPYEFGSGLTVTFGDDAFTQSGATSNYGPDNSIEVVATSEQVVWSQAQSNEDGLFEFDLSFAASSQDASNPGEDPTVTQTVSLNLGARSSGDDNDYWIIEDDFSTTQYANNSSTTRKVQDGYPESSLERVYFTQDGVLVGVYSHNREEDLYQLPITTFLNPWGLNKEGDNLFSISRHSDEGYTNAPGEGASGTVLGNFLEQSTVDTATEMVQMILTQRGFQANSKSVTTHDEMLKTAINIKS